MEVDQNGPFGYPPYAGHHPDPRAQALAQQQQQRSLQSKPNKYTFLYFCGQNSQNNFMLLPQSKFFFFEKSCKNASHAYVILRLSPSFATLYAL